MAVSEHINCMECGGRAYLLQPLDPEDPPAPGDVLAYRCPDCAERWDVVVDEADLETSIDDE
jgi:hypothetical protein